MAFLIEVKLTSELTDGERARFCSLFFDVFGRPFPEDLFLRKYLQAHNGNSLHALAIQDQIAGAFSAVLFRYSFFGRECLFAIAVDLMLESKFRPDVRLVKQMSDALYRRLADEGVAFVFSCVREEMMRFHEVLSGWRNIGRLSYYVAPVRGHFFIAGAVLRALIRSINAVGRSGNGDEGAHAIYKVDDEAFRRYRYHVFSTEYRTVKVDGGGGVYARKMFWEIPGVPRGVRLGMLVDVWPARREVFDDVVREIVRTDRDIDYLIYAGCLRFQPRFMWRVPRRLERSRYYLGGRILRPDLIDDRVYDIDNWSINLSNTDLV